MSRLVRFVIAGAMLTGSLPGADLQPLNDLPNPYRTVRDWGTLPAGTTAWAAVTAVEVSPDGSIYVIHRCHDNSCVDRNEPPILKMDKGGKLITGPLFVDKTS